MKKVITYGTFDLLHHGHIRLLERAKALGDYLIVGVTSDDFDKSRGKINGQQSLMERVEAVKETGLADEIIIEEYEGQKIDDIQRYNVDVFTVGSDWKGKFDYLNEFCEVVYLDRTEGISSTKLRTEENCIKLGFVGESSVINKFFTESKFVDGIEPIGICTNSIDTMLPEIQNLPCVTNDFNVLLDKVDAVYIISHPDEHYNQIKYALMRGKHILCESPVVTKLIEFEELMKLAKLNNCVIMESIKTDYSLAYSRLLLLLKSGIIGDVVSVDSVCTSLRNLNFDDIIMQKNWNSIYAWGPTAMLPIFQILGTNYKTKNIVSKFSNKTAMYDIFTKIDFIYKNAVASLKVGKGVKSEGNLVITGTKGFVYVPSPWWKTDYFEVRFEQQELNKRFFYQLEGEGIRYELVNFIKEINGRKALKIDSAVTEAIIKCIEDFKENHMEI